MPRRGSRIIFDTSGLNALADDSESRPITKSLAVGFQVRLSETNISEIAATPKQERRLHLLDLCKHLVQAGEVIRPYHWIVQEMARQYTTDPARFDWRQVEVRFPELEEEVARRRFLENAGISDEMRADNDATNSDFELLFRKSRGMLAPLFEEYKATNVSISDVLDLLTVEESPLWALAGDVYGKATGRHLTRPEIHEFIECCPPLRAILLGICIGQYHWGVKKEREQALYKAGALDLFMTVYLPFCDRFITNDSGQCNALRLVAERAGFATEVCMYADFRRGFLIAA
jgi:hypothetical protein